MFSSKNGRELILRQPWPPCWRRCRTRSPSASSGRFAICNGSLAQTVSDAYQELQQKALAQRWPAVEYPQLENLARKALVLLRHHILDRARRGKHRVPLDEALSTYADSRQPSEDFEARETAALVQMAVDSLEPDWRDAVRMKYLEGYSNEAIARVLGKPSNDAVRMLLVRARSALAELLIPSHE